MKKTIKNIMIIAGIGLISGTTILSCQQRSKSNESNTEEQETIQNIENRVQNSYEEAKSKLEGVFAEDPEFVTKLDIKLQEFNQSLNNLEDEVKAEGEEINEEVKTDIAHLKAETRELEEKIESWGEASAEDLEELKNEIAEDFNRLVASLDSTKI